MLEREDRSFIVQKFKEVRQGFDKIDPSIPVHLELASMADPARVKDILDQVIQNPLYILNRPPDKSA